jgi:hypothetical protein
MARSRPSPGPLVAPAGFVASAVRLPTIPRAMAGTPEGWQTAAWQYWESIGELRYVSSWIGNVLSRARLVAAKREGRMLVPILEDSPATEALDALYGGPQGQAEMLQLYGMHSTIAGEEYIVNLNGDDSWHTLAAGKVAQEGTGRNARLRANFGTGQQTKYLSKSDLVIHIWTPNPIDPTRADSPTRANLSTLAQIVGYDKHIEAQIRSRLAGAGILFLSNEAEFPVPPGMDPAASSADAFMATLAEAMTTPIQNPGDPSALVPIVAMVPTESLGKNEHLHFWTELDNNVTVMRDSAIKRLATGMNVPPEIMLGMADSTHWNAWLSEESAVKADIEPVLAVFAYALTEQYLQPALKGLVDDVEDFFIIADTSSIRLRPNRSREAIDLYDRGELSGEALRRETGFQPEDAPQGNERLRWLLTRISTGAVSPEMTMAALTQLGVDFGQLRQLPSRPPDHTRTDTTPTGETLDMPDIDAGRQRAIEADTVDRGLAAALNGMVLRALERAGGRLKNLHPRTDCSLIPNSQIYRSLTGDPDKLLAGAWDEADRYLESYTDDIPAMVSTLDFYVRGILSTQRPHSQVVLGALLKVQPSSIAMV